MSYKCLFFAVVSINDAASKEGNKEGSCAAADYHPEEFLVANSLLDITSNKTWENHTKRHETGADSIV